jgi:dolichol-phosphate mannosyltransferase
MISVVIPTYNEKENIKKLVPRVFDILDNVEVIIVDDNSPDGTRDVIKTLQKKYNIKLIERSGKMGIGSAYKAGFRAARGDIIFEMDADLSHNPDFMAKFIDAIKSGYDVAVGSRYINGGGIKGWGIYRKSVSKTANALSQLLLKINVSDVTTGFRAYRKSALSSIDLDEIKSDGYSFQLEILFKLFKKGYKIKEIPIIFEDRKAGESKLARKEMLNYIGTVLRLMFYDEEK